MDQMNIPESDMDWAAEPIIGLVLENAETDSNGDDIKLNDYYKVGKHLPSGKVVIIHLPKITNALNHIQLQQSKWN